MTKVKLGEICTPKQWKTISTEMLIENGYPVYGANGVIGFYSEYNHEDKTILVTCRGATCGSLNVCEPFSYVNGNAMALDNLNPAVELDYLYYFLKGRGLSDIISGSAQPQIIRSAIEKIDILICDKAKQLAIIRKLKSIETIINLRKKQIYKLDELIKARFVEMFGDPIINHKGWKIVTIGDVVTDVRYGTSKPAVEGGKYPYLRMNNLTIDGHLDLTNLKYIDIPDDEIEKCVVRKGDILFNRTNSVELVGKTAVFDLSEEMIIAGYIIRVRLKDVLLPEVFGQFMNLEVMKNTLRGMAKGAVNQANINAQELQSINIYLPDISLQKEFVKIKE